MTASQFFFFCYNTELCSAYVNQNILYHCEGYRHHVQFTSGKCSCHIKEPVRAVNAIHSAMQGAYIPALYEQWSTLIFALF